MNKTCCIYHKIDLDGWMSAAIVKLWFIIKIGEHLSNIKFIGFNYGDQIPDLSEYNKIIMCDVSFPKEEMYKLGNNINIGKLIWIDHHISAINDSYTGNYNRIEGIRDIKYAACELTWKYFFPNDSMPELVRRLGRYDCFGHIGTDEEQMITEFQYGARMVINNYTEAYQHLIDEGMDYQTPELNTLNIIHEKGKIIYNYLCNDAKKSYKNGFDMYFYYPNESKRQVKFLAINKERFNPANFKLDYHNKGYDGCACFYYSAGLWKFSLYNENKSIDCSLIAKQFNGGGHAGASGFVLNTEEFIRLLNGNG